MKKILIAYDGSSCAQEALEDLPRAGLPKDAEARVISVAEVWWSPHTEKISAEKSDLMSEAVRRAREAARHAVEEHALGLARQAAASLKETFPHWHVEAIAAGDSAAWGILKQAAAWPADLIVVGSHGRSALERLFLGSVSHKVANEAQCSVHIARPRRPARQHNLRLLVAVDGSPDSETAVNAVLSRSWPPLAEFELIAVIDSRLQTLGAWPTPWANEWTQRHDADAGQWVCRAVERLATRFREAALTVETHIVEGDPKQMLLKHANERETDCIFLGAHGLDHGEQRSLGTLASAIATHAPCSVEIVRLETSHHRPPQGVREL